VNTKNILLRSTQPNNPRKVVSKETLLAVNKRKTEKDFEVNST